MRCVLYSDPFEQFASENKYLASFDGHLNDINTVLELQKASQVITRPNESVLKSINSWSAEVLKRHCADDPTFAVGMKSYVRREVMTVLATLHSHFCHHEVKRLHRLLLQVEDVLRFPAHTSLQRLENKRYINIYNARSAKVLKTLYRYIYARRIQFWKLNSCFPAVCIFSFM